MEAVADEEAVVVDAIVAIAAAVAVAIGRW